MITNKLFRSIAFLIVTIASQSIYAQQNIITVSPVGGDFSDPVAAMNSIVDASAVNRYIIRIAPGSYELSETLVTKPFVRVSGSGVSSTSLFFNDGLFSMPVDTAMVVVGNVEIDNLSISGINGSGPTGIKCTDQSARILLENTSVSGVTGMFGALGVSLSGCTGVVIRNSTLSASGGDGNAGLAISNSVVTMSDSSISASGAMIRSSGISAVESVLTLSNVRVNVRNLGGLDDSPGINIRSSSMVADDLRVSSSGNKPVGISNTDSSVVMNGLTVTAVGQGSSPSSEVGNVVGVKNNSTSPRITNARITVTVSTGVSDQGVGIQNTNSSRPTIENSQISVFSTTNNIGVHNSESSGSIARGSFISTARGNLTAFFNDSTSDSRTLNSSFIGNIGANEGGIARFVNTEFIGNVSVSGQAVCLNSYNSSLVELSRSCR